MGRIILGLRCSSFFAVWLSIEVNLIRFLGLLIISSSSNIWVGIKYFLIQSMGSFMMIFPIQASWIFRKRVLLFILIFRIRLKLAIAPFQFWILSLSNYLRWESFFYLSSFQKILPLYLLLSFSNSKLFFLLVLRRLLSFLGGFFSRKLISVLIYSSILRIRWVISRNWIFLRIIYFFIYRLRLLILRIVFFKQNSLNQNDISFLVLRKAEILALIFSFLNLAGIPPLIGFFLKVIIFFQVISVRKILVIVLLISSLVFSFIYIRIFLVILVGNTNKSVISSYNTSQVITFTMLLLLRPIFMFLS